MGRVITTLILCTLGGGLIAGFRHYNQSYQPTLHGGEGWIHILPRDYAEEFAENAGMFRDHVYLGAMPGAEVSVLTQNDRLFTKGTSESRRDTFRKTMARKLPGSSFDDCGGYRVESTKWTCLEWSKGDTLQRVYFTHRGTSNILVVFTASPPGRFAYFGEPTRWLSDLEWHGPSIAYAF